LISIMSHVDTPWRQMPSLNLTPMRVRCER
jgi:hypothetical protein